MLVKSLGEGNRCCQAHEGEESRGELVVAGGDAAVALELLKEVLDEVALAVERLLVARGLEPIGARWNAGLYRALPQPLTERIAVISFVAHELSALYLAHGVFCSGNVRFLARAQQQRGWPASPVDRGVQLGVETALGPAHRLSSLPSRGIAAAALHLDVG